MEWTHNQYKISDVLELIDSTTVHALLRTSYWASDRDLETVRQSIENSLCFGVYLAGKQVGFVRVITDHCTTAFIADLIIDPNNRGQGLGKRIMTIIQEHPQVPESVQVLKTKDAHGLYEQFGFVRGEFMVRKV